MEEVCENKFKSEIVEQIRKRRVQKNKYFSKYLLI